MNSPELAPPPRPLRSRLPWPHLSISGTLFFCTIGFVADLMNFNVVLAEVFLADKRLRADEVALGYLGAISALGYFLPALAMGLLSERLGRRPMILTSMAGLTLTYILLPRVTSLSQLYTLSFIRSAFTSMLWPPLMAWMSQISEPAALSRVLGRYNTSWSLGILAGFGAAGWLAEHHGTNAPFRLSLILGVGMLLFVLLVLPRAITQPASSQSQNAPTAQDVAEQREPFFSLAPAVARLWVIRGLALMGLGCAVQGMVLYLTPKLVGPSVGESAQGMLQVSRMSGQMLGFLAFSLTAAWHFRLWPLPAALGCFFVGLIGSGIIASQAATPFGFAALCLSYGVAGFGFGIIFMLSSYYALGLLRSKGLGSGLMETMVGGGNLFGPLIAGSIAGAYSPQFAFYMALIPLSAAALLAVPWERGIKNEE